MPLGKLEPLYRYLRNNNGTNAVQKLLGDMETLAKGGYIKNADEGIHRVVTSDTTNREIADCIKRELGDAPVTNLHVMCQANNEHLYISISRVSSECCKTCLAVAIAPDDTATIDYIEPNVFDRHVKSGDTIYSSVSTVVIADDGPPQRGFIRYETTFMRTKEPGHIAFKIDFKMTRAAPIYVGMTNIRSETGAAAFVGRDAKTMYERLEAEWKA